MSRPRINLSDAVDDLAPPPPKCFLNGAIWKEYLKSAAAVQNHKGEQPIILLKKGEPSFNMAMSFCVDCETAHKTIMRAAGKCLPRHLQVLAEAQQQEEATA